MTNNKIKVLEVKNITKIYKVYKSNLDRLKEIFIDKKYHKDFKVNDNISFDLYRGETLGIIGANGAGKSTILKILARVIEPTLGEVKRHGKVTALLELGTGFNAENTGHNNIYLNGTLIGMTKEEITSKIDQIIAFSELGEYIYEPMKSYSSGMKMRLAFSIAIFSDPQILIVDEALSVGDAHFSAKCTNALRERKKQNMSIIYVSHDLNSLKILCDRAILLSHGNIIEHGSPESVINTYNFLISKQNNTDTLITKADEDNSSFGTFDVEIKNVTIKGKSSNTNTISSGENSTIEIEFKANKDIDNVNIGILIKDQFGQDIYGTTTKNYGLEFSVKKNRSYKIKFDLDLNIGIGKYSISTALTIGENHLNNCLHWMDFSQDFEILDTKDQQFIGLCRLKPTIHFNEVT